MHFFEISDMAELTVSVNLASTARDCYKKSLPINSTHQQYPNKVPKNAYTELWLVKIKNKMIHFIGCCLKRFISSACPSCSKPILLWKFVLFTNKIIHRLKVNM